MTEIGYSTVITCNCCSFSSTLRAINRKLPQRWRTLPPQKGGIVPRSVKNVTHLRGRYENMAVCGSGATRNTCPETSLDAAINIRKRQSPFHKRDRKDLEFHATRGTPHGVSCLVLCEPGPKKTPRMLRPGYVSARGLRCHGSGMLGQENLTHSK